MRVLFVHSNFPGQFRHLAGALAARGDTVFAIGGTGSKDIAGVTVVRSRPACPSARDGHPWSGDFDAKIIRADATMAVARRLDADGFQPDVIVAHPGWGESLFLKQLWPDARLGIYCEFFYGAPGADSGFDPEFPVADPLAEACRLQVRNASMVLHFALADGAMAPTQWQADTFPLPFRDRIRIIHDGIDVSGWEAVAAVPLQIGATTIVPGDEVVTFVARNLEPYRGYHRFMRALPAILARRPHARVLIVGGDGVSYGMAPPGGQSWRDLFFNEVAAKLDRSRVHFLGQLPQNAYRAVLRLSTVHVYLTYPFVISWSLLEAMTAGCAVVASDTAPVREVVGDGTSGELVPFFDTGALAERVCELLDDPERRARLGAGARSRIAARYDLANVCLPRQLDWVDGLASVGRDARMRRALSTRSPSLTRSTC